MAAIWAGERETLVAYERASGHPEVGQKIQALFERCSAETHTHMAWLQSTQTAK